MGQKKVCEITDTKQIKQNQKKKNRKEKKLK